MRIVDADVLITKLLKHKESIRESRFWCADDAKVYKDGITSVIEIIQDELSFADVVPARRGKWSGKHGSTCSLCGYISSEAYLRKAHFCPNCGAKMEESSES